MGVFVMKLHFVNQPFFFNSRFLNHVISKLQRSVILVLINSFCCGLETYVYNFPKKDRVYLSTIALHKRRNEATIFFVNNKTHFHVNDLRQAGPRSDKESRCNLEAFKLDINNHFPRIKL